MQLFYAQHFSNTKPGTITHPAVTIIHPFLPSRLGHMLWGNCSVADHSVNLLLHAIVTLLYAHTLLHALRLKPLQVLLSGLTFATHPVHTEAVGSDGGSAGVWRGEQLTCWVIAKALHVEVLQI